MSSTLILTTRPMCELGEGRREAWHAGMLAKVRMRSIPVQRYTPSTIIQLLRVPGVRKVEGMKQVLASQSIVKGGGVPERFTVPFLSAKP